MDNQFLNTGTGEVSPFTIIEDREPPRLLNPGGPFYIGIPALVVLVALYVYFIGVVPIARGAGLVVLVSLIISLTVLSSRSRRARMDAILELLTSLTHDLDNLRDSLDKYLKRLDVRASRYFNSMRPSEASLKYFLAQISTALEHRVMKIRHFLSDPGMETIAAAYQYLQVPLRIRESVIEKEGKQKLIPLKDLRQICSQYIEEIEGVLSRIEKERAEKDYDIPFDDYNDDNKDDFDGQ